MVGRPSRHDPPESGEEHQASSPDRHHQVRDEVFNLFQHFAQDPELHRAVQEGFQFQPNGPEMTNRIMDFIDWVDGRADTRQALMFLARYRWDIDYAFQNWLQWYPSPDNIGGDCLLDDVQPVEDDPKAITATEMDIGRETEEQESALSDNDGEEEDEEEEEEGEGEGGGEEGGGGGEEREGNGDIDKEGSEEPEGQSMDGETDKKNVRVTARKVSKSADNIRDGASIDRFCAKNLLAIAERAGSSGSHA